MKQGKLSVSKILGGGSPAPVYGVWVYNIDERCAGLRGCLPMAWLFALLCIPGTAQGQAAQNAANPQEKESGEQKREIQELRLQAEQLRNLLEAQMDLIERRIDALETTSRLNLPEPDKQLQSAISEMREATKTPGSGGASTNAKQVTAEQQSGISDAKTNLSEHTSPTIAQPHSTGDAEQDATQKEERTRTGKESGKTPTYQNINEEQNPIVPQAKGFEFHGYLRSGDGLNSQGGQQVAFQAPGAPAKYRLGNETDTYGEFVFVNNWVNASDAADHAWFHTEILISADTNQSAQGDTGDTFNLREAFVRGGNLIKTHPDWKLWAGERYYRRWNVDEIDWYMQDMSGYGGGIEDVHVAGPVKFAFAYLVGAVHGDQLDDGVFLKNTFDLDWYGLPLLHGNLGGRFYYSNAKGGQLQNSSSRAPGARGYGVEVGHNLKHLLGGNDRSVIQYATGEAANFSTTAITPQPWIRHATGLRLVNQFLIEPGDPHERFSIFATTAYQRYKSLNAADAVDSWVSFGGRPAWYFTNHFNFVLETGADHVIESSGGYSGWLRKVTLAPQLSSGRGYYSRPALRLFVSYASWTKGFKGLIGGPTYDNLTQGITAGLQFENWW